MHEFDAMVINVRELYSKLESFTVVKCDLFHEKVALDPTTGLPLINSAQNGDAYQRVQLCDNELRQVRLGCAHSSANANFMNCLVDLITVFPSLESSKTAIDKIIFRIYQLDHLKGDLEKEVAEQLSNKGTRSHAELELDIVECIEKHRIQMQLLDEQRKNVLSKVAELISASDN